MCNIEHGIVPEADLELLVISKSCLQSFSYTFYVFVWPKARNYVVGGKHYVWWVHALFLVIISSRKQIYNHKTYLRRSLEARNPETRRFVALKYTAFNDPFWKTLKDNRLNFCISLWDNLRVTVLVMDSDLSTNLQQFMRHKSHNEKVYVQGKIASHYNKWTEVKTSCLLWSYVVVYRKVVFFGESV